MSNVEGLNELRTFGWSLSSGVDVDNNRYNGEREREGGRGWREGGRGREEGGRKGGRKGGGREGGRKGGLMNVFICLISHWCRPVNWGL